MSRSIRPQKPSAPQVSNNTGLPLDKITKRRQVGSERNVWRERNVTLYEGPDEGHVYSVGRAFNGEMIVIALEPASHYKTALLYWKNGLKTHVSQ